MQLRKLWNRTFWSGVIVGVGLVVLGRFAINQSTIPDRLLAPLLLEDSTARADAIVVLGAGVIGDCVANINGVRRALLGAKLFNERRAPLIVISGGSGDGHCPVADAMAQIVLAAGIPSDKLVLERESRNTRENGERTAPLLTGRHVTRILLVTDRLHMRRALGVFARFGFNVEPVAGPIYEGHIDNGAMLSAGIRETAALAYYRWRGWASPMPARHATAGVRRNAGTGTSGDIKSANEVQHQESKTSAPSAERPIVILGASYARGWKLSAVDNVAVINAGVAGQQSVEMLSRFESDVAAIRPRAVVLWGFINDIFRSDDAVTALARTRDSYAEMIRRARAQGIEPIVATEVTIRPPNAWSQSVMGLIGSLLGKESYQMRVNAHVLGMNRWLKELAERESLLLLDLQPVVSGADGQRRREFATNDGSHISPQGYDALTAYAVPILAERFRAAAVQR